VFAELDPTAKYATAADLRSALRDNLNRAVNELEESALADPLLVAAMQLRLGVSLLGLGEANLAIRVLEKALATRKAELGPDHPDTILCMSVLALGYQEAGQLEKALPLHEDTLKRITARLGPDHPNTVTAMGSLGKAYAAAKQGEKAATTLAGFVAGMRKTLPKASPQLAGLLAQVALDLLACGQFRAAEAMLRECLAIRETTQPDSWQTFNTRSSLGGALLGQKKYAEAEPLLLKGYEGLKAREKTISPQANTRIPEALDRLIALYTATNQPDAVKKWQAERAKHPEPKQPGKQ
jgi:tetratricopeptide (TPR) repeat protein